ncbi:alpha/beta hydrolase [Rhodomicrobium vannielii ATCC 17100]|uniref:alpha/beta fold hydrolase n=1 Tax=Rhodomicrobium vannielii TaxID=1069 RepID=UPI00191815BB|nr:alpha/beta hydrolase [Rhodomicrobium vannielii]MBJ7535891.1 alpha/beta hydrolase [Rhodomicrobium vannielii ATCC 17100]
MTTYGSAGAAVPQTEDIFYRSHDDLVLYVRKYGSDDAPARPLLCLAGLTRNGRDFHDLAVALSTHPTHPRAVYCLDYRGRGRSEWDKDWRNYSALIELQDIEAFLTLRGLSDVAVLGTSRGGIIAMLLAITRPAAIGCAILNDIGPVIETAGLARIMGYTGKIPVPADWDEALRVVRDINKRQFTALDSAGWRSWTRQLFNEDAEGRPAPSYDPNIGKALSEIDISKAVPTMWEHFESLRSVPVMVIRGEHSDLLSAATVQEMQARHPRLTPVLIPNEGHAPLLKDRFSERLIADFLIDADSTWHAVPRPPLPEPQEIFSV